MNYRTFFGLIITAFWLVGGLVYLHFSVGLGNIFSLKPNELGDFAAGFLAPMAFLWLVIGYFQQGEELRLQRRELELQRSELSLQRAETHRLADQAERQAESVAANEIHARRDTFLRIAELTSKELLAITVHLLRASGVRINYGVLWDRYGNGESDIFFNELIALFVQGRHENTISSMRNHMDWPVPLENYCRRFRYLIENADASDPDGYLGNHFRESAMGKLFMSLDIVVQGEVIETMEKADRNRSQE